MEEIKNIKWEISAKEIYDSTKGLFWFSLISFFLIALFPVILIVDGPSSFFETYTDAYPLFDAVCIAVCLYIAVKGFLLNRKIFNRNKKIKSYGNSLVEFYEINDSGICIKDVLNRTDSFYMWNDLKFCKKISSANSLEGVSPYLNQNNLVIVDKNKKQILLRINKNKKGEIMNEIKKKIEIKSV